MRIRIRKFFFVKPPYYHHSELNRYRQINGFLSPEHMKKNTILYIAVYITNKIILELEHAMTRIKWSIVGLKEVRECHKSDLKKYVIISLKL